MNTFNKFITFHYYIKQNFSSWRTRSPKRKPFHIDFSFLHSKRVIIFLIFSFLHVNKLLADYTISAGVTTDPATAPALLNATGTLSIYGTMAINSNVIFTSTTPLTILIYGSGGQIYWYSNASLIFPAGTTITYINNPTAPPGLQPTSGSASKLFQIGDVKYACTNDNSNNVAYSFSQLNSLGGTPKVTLSTATPIVCFGSSINLSANLLIPTGSSIKISWIVFPVSGTFSDNNTSTAMNTTLSGLAVNTYTDTCQLYAVTGAGNYVLVASQVITISVKPSPAITGALSICDGSTTQLTGSGTAAAPSPWVSASPGVATVNSTGLVTSVAAGTSVITYRNIEGCSVPATVTVNSLPSASISYPGNPHCSDGGTASVTFSGTTGGTYTSTAGLTINSTTGAVALGTSTPGTYIVTYTVASSGGCSQYQTTASITIVTPGTWSGAISTAWNMSGNWVCGEIPTSTINATIPKGLTNYPLLNVGIGSAQNITIQTGASVTVTGGTLQIAGSISNSGTFNASTGTIEMNGHLAQTIPANTFINNALNNLIISNTNISGVTLGGALDIYNSLTFSGTGRKLTTNDNLTIKSTAENTAWVGDMTGNFITGQATVERYISARKAWYFLSVPTNTSYTMHQLWQENAADANSDPTPGFGLQLSGSGGIPKGFDKYTASPSVKTYNSSNDSWVEVPSTNTTSMKNMNGYMVFVRGNRLATTYLSPVTETVLRTKGPLYTYDQAPIIVAPGKFQAIGNPYASSLDLRNINSTGLKDFYYIWDPKIGGEFGYGGYQTLSVNSAGDYEVTPGGGSFGAAGSVCNYIRSGWAFFMQATTSGGSLTFKESAKSNSTGQIATAGPLPSSKLRATLLSFNSDNSTYIADGLLVDYRDDYSNKADDMDAIKDINSSENFALKNGNTLLVIERRHTIVSTDTLFLNLTNLQARKYRFEFAAEQIYQPGLTGYLEDTYLHTSTPLNIDGNTSFDFNVVNVAGSYAQNRFRIVFHQSSTLPVTFTSVKAYLQSKNINVEWNVDNERNIQQYEVEKSTDGNHFAKVTVLPATANSGHSAAYNFIDKNAVEGINYYRIKSVDDNGKIFYTNIVKVIVASIKEEIIVYPNPVINGKINLQLNNEPDGNYGLRIFNKAGQQILEKKIQHSSADNRETIQLSNYIAHGIYELKVTKPDGSVVSINIIYQ